MRIRMACLDQGLSWVIDDMIGGLYAINLKTFETECVIGCDKLFPNGTFDVMSLLKWKESYIIIIPREINRKWIFYNKVTGEVEYRKVIERKCQEILIAADQEKKLLYFFPISINDPILIVDLCTLTCLKMIENWSGRMSGGDCKIGWKGAYNGQYIFSPISNTRILVRMDCGTGKVDLLELDISEAIIDIDYSFGELWILPVSGSQIYQIDENGMVVRIVELLEGKDGDSLPDLARIVVQKRYLFLLPYYRKGIYIYDRLKRKTRVIPEINSVSEEEDKKIPLRYWEYYVMDNRICFLPFQDSYIEIDLETLEYKSKEISYPKIWSKQEKIRRKIRSHVSEQDSVIKETFGCDLNTFLEYIRCKTETKDFPESEYTNKKVWDMLNN